MSGLNVVDVATHVCQLYEGPDDLREVTLPFLRDGLRNGDYCMYAAQGDTVDDWYRELAAQGIDVPTARATGALEIIRSETWRGQCQDGSLAMTRRVLSLVEDQLDTFPGVRIAGDVNWAAEPGISADALCHWEATANVVFEGLPARVICQYDITRYEPEFIHAALRTHPIVLYKGSRLRNPFYEALHILEHEPKLNACSNDRAEVADMLAHIRQRRR